MDGYERKKQTPAETKAGCIGGALLAWVLIVVGAFILWGCPTYRVWQRGMQGQAELKQAESNRKIATLEAQAKQESAKALAEAEVIRADGVARANKIIGDSLKGNESYLHYLWLQSLSEGSNDVIYIPTEANVPVMEAGRFLRDRVTTATRN